MTPRPINTRWALNNNEGKRLHKNLDKILTLINTTKYKSIFKHQKS